MDNESNIRTLRPLPPPSAHPCSMCGSRVDVVLCSFAFERTHRRVPLCRQHRQPLLEIDHYTRPDANLEDDVPPAWVAQEWAAATVQRRRPRRRMPREMARGTPTGTLVLVPMG